MLKPIRPRLVIPLLAAAVVLAGCSGGAESSSPGTSPPESSGSAATGSGATGGEGSAGPEAVPAATSEGCGQPVEPGVGGNADNPESEETFVSGGVERTYRLAVPTGGDNTEPRPLVLNFHGSGSNAVQQSVYTRIPERASERGWIAITPDAIDNNWALASPEEATAQDVVFMTELLDNIESRFCVDTNRVWADGISLGAAFSSLLACALPDRIAAAGLVAVEILFQPCPRTLPVLVFHGTEDAVVPYLPGEIAAERFKGAPSAGTEANLADWAELNQCQPEPELTQPSSEIELRTWTGCAAGAETILYSVIGGGHTWPGSDIKVGSLGYTTDQIDATGLILDFFEAHPLKQG